jgi:hypothetical protein
MKTYSKLDPRKNPKVSEIVKKIASVEYIPVVHEHDLLEIEKVFASIPKLEYPINSYAELIEKLGGSGKLHQVAEVTVDPMRMIKYMPAYYFPIGSVENFIEKMAELIRANRKKVDVPKEMEAIRAQLPRLVFPIKTPEELHQQLQDRGQYKFQNRNVNAMEMIKRIPSQFFPFKDRDDFENKIIHSLLYRPLIVKD